MGISSRRYRVHTVASCTRLKFEEVLTNGDGVLLVREMFCNLASGGSVHRYVDLMYITVPTYTRETKARCQNEQRKRR